MTGRGLLTELGAAEGPSHRHKVQMGRKVTMFKKGRKLPFFT